MRIAVISDIHGYSHSLECVLRDIDDHGVFDAIIAAGDIVEEGPDPAGSVDILRARAILAIKGNTDWNVVAADEGSSTRRWSRDRLGSDRLTWLDALPFQHRVSPPGGSAPGDDLLVVHANPSDWHRAIPPDASDHDLEELIGDTRAGAIVFGHIHISYVRKWRGTLLVDVSAVGNPKDGDLRSRWGELTWTGSEWTATIHHVAVDTGSVVEQFRRSGRPNVEKAIAKYLHASYGE